MHFHSLSLDGVYVELDDGSFEFHELPEPSPEQVADVARRTAKRVTILLDEVGKSLDTEMADASRKSELRSSSRRSPPPRGNTS